MYLYFFFINSMFPFKQSKQGVAFYFSLLDPSGAHRISQMQRCYKEVCVLYGVVSPIGPDVARRRPI